MSLASYASPFNEDNNNIKLKSNHQKVTSNRVTKLLNKIHESFDNNDDNLVDFNPPPMPKSAGVHKTVSRESGVENSRELPKYTEYYNSNIESFKPFNVYNKPVQHENEGDVNKKLNDILRLLQEQQESRTDHVTEEIILYSFFGIFIIYLVDSFKSVGKYTR